MNLTSALTLPRRLRVDRRRARGTRTRPRTCQGLAAVTLVGLLAACSLPSVDNPDGEPSGREAPIAAEPPDPSEEQVRSAVADLLVTVEAGRSALMAAAAADTAEAARAEAERALAALVRDRGRGEPPPTGPLFPDETSERGSTDEADDRFTRTLTVARDSGAPGSQLLDLLRDPIAGDLGGWQRDAAGVLSGVEATTATATDLDQLEVEIAQLAGLGTRAVAWNHLATDAGDLASATAYAERGAANLEVIVLTLERFVEGLGEDADAPDDAGDSASDAA